MPMPPEVNHRLFQIVRERVESLALIVKSSTRSSLAVSGRHSRRIKVNLTIVTLELLINQT